MEGRGIRHLTRGPLGESTRVGQKHLTSASAWARRKSFRALLACSDERNWPPRLPRTWDMLSTVSAVTYRSKGSSEARTSIEQEHCSIVCRVSPLAFMQPNTYSIRALV